MLLVTVAVFYVGWHAAVRGWEQQRRLTCAAVLQRLVVAAKPHADELALIPGSSMVDTMIARKWTEPKNAACPSHPQTPSNHVLLIENFTATDPRTVVAYEPKTNHADEGGNIVFADGHSSFLQGEDYDRLIAALGAGQSVPARP